MPRHPKSKAKPKPKTKAGKKRKVAKVLGEFKRGTLRSSSGDKVTDPDQAVAIAARSAGLPKKRRKRAKT